MIVLYLATPSGERVREAIEKGSLGQLITPNSGNKKVNNAIWALDNGCFSDKWSEPKWLTCLNKYQGVRDCLFACCPDVVGDASATNKLWDQWSLTIQSMGYAAAYVTQNGCTSIPSNADALFTGGDDEWKLGPDAQALVVTAKARGLWCHMGRVNSRKRIQYANRCGYDSVDGTMLAFGPNKNLPKLLQWMEEVNTQGVLL